jgi:uncharacterized protein (TIGR04255 family)
LKNSIIATGGELLFQPKPYNLFARWGLLPPRATTDPALMKPLDKPSWILDIDVSHSGKRAWHQAQLIEEFGKQTESSYNFFRWAVTDKFLTHFGGKL